MKSKITTSVRFFSSIQEDQFQKLFNMTTKLLPIVMLLFSTATFAQVGINTTTPDQSAILDINSTTGGVLLPRMTTAQRDAIPSPKSGLTIFNETALKFQGYFNGSITSIDQSNLLENSTSSGSTEYGQSFTAGQTGQLVSVEFISTTANATATLVVGAGTLAGSNTTTFNMVIGTNVVTLATPLALTTATVYNFRVNASNLAIRFSNTDSYAGGNLLQPGAGSFPTFDFYFKTNVFSTVAGWQDLNSGGETDPKVGFLANNLVPKWNGTTLSNSQIFDNGQRVGIGTNTPVRTVEILKDYAELQITNALNGAGVSFGPGGTGPNGGVYTGGIGTTNNFDFPIYTNNSDRVTIKGTTGFVGIGTNSPNAPLQLANTTGNRKFVLYESTNNDHQFYGLGINNATLRFQTDAVGADHVFFAGTSATTSNELMRIKGNGNVGIGVAPTEKLEVAGKTKTIDLQVTTATPAVVGQVLTATDVNGNMAWQTPATATSEIQKFGNIVRNTTDTANDSFVIGSTSLDDIAGFNDNNRMFYSKAKAAFRVGGTDNTNWDNTNMGIYSNGIGYRTKASGNFSNAFGNATTASGLSSTAIGDNATASANYTTAIGNSTTAQSYNETTIGSFNTDAVTPDAFNFVATDRLFTIGNGASSLTKSNAITVLKNGNTAIGNINPTERLDVDGKTKTIDLQVTNGAAANKVLTSDASGNATWQTPASGGTTETASNGLTKTGNDIQLGGALTANTTITQTAAQALNFNNNGTANTTINLQSTGDFDIQDNGTSALFVSDAAKVGIGTNTPDVSAQLDITSTTGGVLLPRMTTTQRDAIASPKAGLTIYNTTSNKFQGYATAIGATTVDQAQLTTNATSSGAQEYGQSFQAGVTGQLVSISVNAGSAITGAVLTVGAGSLIGTNTTTVNIVSGLNVITLATPFNVAAGSIYNFRLDYGSGNTVALSFSTSNPYPNGVLLAAGNGSFPGFDLFFRTNVQTVSGAWQDLNITIPAATPETDPKVATTTTNKVPKWNGTNLVDGIITDNGTNIGIGVTPTEKLEVAGKTKTTNLQVTAGTPAAGKVLTATDAAGNATWQAPATTATVGVKFYIVASGIFPDAGSGNLVNGSGAMTMGTIFMHVATSTVEGNSIPCDGRLLNISSNIALFSIIGTTYGGNGTTNFAVPNFTVGSGPVQR